jgi:hypothetical protein
MLENMLYAIDIYNDASDIALNVLKVQHIYDEIEAEVNLVFDQLMYLLSEEVYIHSKDVASMLHLDDSFLQTLHDINRHEKNKGIASVLIDQYHDVHKERYRSVVNQRHVQLLGRSIDVRTLMVERLNASLRRDIEMIVSRFESNDITGICELEGSLTILKETYLHLTTEIMESDSALDSFDMVLEEVNEMVGGGGSHAESTGRIGRHVLIELVRDVYPNWIYNEITRRFIKPAAGSMRKDDHENRKTERTGKRHKNNEIFGRKYSKAYDAKYKLLRGYFGREHCESIINVLERTNGLYIILDQLIEYQKVLVLEEIAPYVAQLQIGLRPIKLPPYQLRAGGSYLAIQLALKPIMDYEDLKSQVFQNFRETGNALAFFHLMDATMTQSNCFEFIATSSFLGVSPASLNSSRNGSTSTNNISRSHTAVPYLEIMKKTPDNLPKEGGPSLFDMAKRAVGVYGITEHNGQKVGAVGYAERTRDPLLTVALNTMKIAVDESMKDTRRGGIWEDGGSGNGSDSGDHLQGISEDDGEGEGKSTMRPKSRANSESEIDERPYLWDDSSVPSNGVVNVNTTKAFHRIYSAMQFMFCEPPSNVSTSEQLGASMAPPPLPIHDRQEFGDGLAWCGIALVHVLNQRARYEMSDFASHVLCVSEWEGMHDTDMVGSVDQQTLSTLQQFLGHAREAKLQSSRLFDLFQSHYKRTEEEMVVFHPPTIDMVKLSSSLI